MADTTSHFTPLKSFDSLFQESWDVLGKIWKKLFVVYLLVYASIFATGFIVAVVLVLGWIGFRMAGLENAVVPGVFLIILGVLLFIASTLVVSSMVSIVLIRVVKDRKAPGSLKQLFKESWKDIIPYSIVITFSSFVIMSGYLLFIIPGLIFSVWFMFAPYEYIYRGTRGVAALHMSMTYVKGRWWQVAWRGMVLSLIAFVVSFTLEIITKFSADSVVMVFILTLARIVVSVVTGLLALVYTVILYEDVMKTYTGGDVVVTKKQRYLYIAGSAFGIVMLFAVLLMIIVASSSPEINEKFEFRPYGNQGLDVPEPEVPMYDPNINISPGIFQNLTPPSENYPDYMR